MKRSEVKSETIVTTGLRAATAVARERAISKTTLWRMGRRQWVKLVNIAGRSYVDLQSLAEFDERARKGEFSQAPVGAAAASQKARIKREAL